MNGKRSFGVVAAFFLMVSVFAGVFFDVLHGAETAKRPNIILIMADDMGYSDIGCYGSEIETPNLDKLAAHGLRYTQFYNGARCCPTRAALLTGLYAHQTGMGCMEPDWKAPGYRGNLNDQCVTLAEALKKNGYGTYMAGKWHVTNTRKARTLKDQYNWPKQRGFDQFYGTIVGGGSFFNTQGLKRNNDDIAKEASDDDDYYYTDAISDNSVKFINEHVKKSPNKPFFEYVAYTAPHWPLHAKKKDIEKYRGKYDMGWDKLRAERLKRMKELGVIDKKTQLSPSSGGLAWDDLAKQPMNGQLQAIPGMTSEKLPAYMALKMSIYAAQIDSMDQGIGKIIQCLKDNKIYDNTLVIFLADNGGCAEYGAYGFGVKEFNTMEKVGGPRSWASYGANWACASNTPFRYFKHYIHEGGIATPLIVHWPAGIKETNAIRKEYVGHIIDFMPTFLELAGGTYPKTFGGKPITPMAGVSMVPSFQNAAQKRHKPLFWEHHGNCGVRDGNWKLVKAGLHTPWSLYDVVANREETNDLASKYPQRVKTLAAQWEAWARRSNVYPLTLGRLRRSQGAPKRDIRNAKKEIAAAKAKSDSQALKKAQAKLAAAEKAFAERKATLDKAYTDAKLPVPK